MRIKHSLLLAALVVSGSLSAQDRQIRPDSKITGVIVFLSGAQVQRSSAALEIPAGNSDVVFAGLSPFIDVQSIQVKGEGAFTILSVNKQNNFLDEQKASEERSRLDQAIEDLGEKIQEVRDRQAILKSEEEILAKNQTVGSDAAGVDPVKLKLVLDFQRTRLTEIKAAQADLSRKMGALAKDLEKLNRQLGEINGRARRNTSEIIVKVSAKAMARGSMSVSYLVGAASWFPTYDLRAVNISKPVELVYKANVNQRSGEDWKDVKLTLSSGDPSLGGNKPALEPYYVGYAVQRNGSFSYGTLLSNITSVSGTVLDSRNGSALPGVTVRVKGTSIAVSTNINGQYTLQVPQGGLQTLTFSFIGYTAQDVPVRSNVINARMFPGTSNLEELSATSIDQALQGRLAGVAASKEIKIRGSAQEASIPVEVNAKQAQTNVQFEIKDPYTITGDGKQITVNIGEFELPATYSYYAVPKLTPDAFLNAKITGFNDLNLLSGEAGIFFEGAFLGKTLVDVENANDTLNVSLGTDKNIVITRERQKDMNEKAFIGSNTRASRGYLITARNRKSQPVNLVIEDQLPLSTTDEISVEKQELSGAKLDEQSGRLTWEFMLQPAAEKKLLLKYQVKFPKNKPVVVE